MPQRNSRALTDTGIGKIGRAPKGKRAERFDALAPGLSLRITDKGSKSWSCYYRLNGKHQRLTIGAWPAVKVAEAREQAREVKEQAKMGIDPKVAREAARLASKEATQAEAEATQQKTFGHIAERYIKHKYSKWKRGHEYESTTRQRLLGQIPVYENDEQGRRRIKEWIDNPHCSPPWIWRERPITEIKRLDLTELTNVLIDAGKPAAARRLYEAATTIFRWAENDGYIETSVFSKMKPPVKKVPRTRVLSYGEKEGEINEIKVLWQTWTQMGYPFGPLQKLLLLLGTRRGEVAEMIWSEIQPDGRTWIIPKDRAKMSREHLIPLPDAAISVLEELPRFNGGDFVFTTTSGRKPVFGFSKCAVRTRKLSGITDWTLHDLRRTCRTGLAKLKVPQIVAELAIGHVGKDTLIQNYDLHDYEDERREALNKWAERVMELVTPPTPQNVVALRPAKSA